MAKVKLGIDGKNAESLFAYSTSLITTIAEPASAAIYPTLEPSAVDFKATHDALGTNIALIASLEAQLEAARAAQPGIVEAHEDNIRKRAAYVETTSGGDPAKIPLGGFAVAGAPEPIGPLPAPQNVKATMSTFPGVVKVQCEVIEGTKSYIAECREHIDGTAWVQFSIGPRKCEKSGLTSGKYYAFRMAVVGAAGQSPWSDECVCMAP